ncbi:MAG: peptidase domain protein, partial [Verrucomicrobia bacterium]|nr:peptidase domain protein [Verrucomicrobiota bacterium]
MINRLSSFGRSKKWLLVGLSQFLARSPFTPALSPLRGEGEHLVSQSGFGQCKLTVVLLLLGAISTVQAQYLPLTRLSTVYPMGGKAGSTNEVEVAGLDLEEVKVLTATHPGITAKPKEGAENRFIINIAANVPVGFYEVRIGGKFGLSNPRAFLVSDRDERLDPGGNNAVEKGFELPLNLAVHGRADANLADYYRVQLKAGQRVGVECLTRELDSRLEPAVAVLDANGKELLRQRFEGQLNFEAPADGAYLVRVSDALFRGGPEYFYRLEVTTVPQVEVAVPATLTAGKEQKVTLYGHRLPGAKASTVKDSRGQLMEQEEVTLTPPQEPPTAFSIMAARPASAGISVFEYRYQKSNPVLFE